jgi:predicted DNA-binding transcriptional regulator AlpA
MPSKVLEIELARVIAEAIRANPPQPSEPMVDRRHNRGPPLDSEPPIYDLAGFCDAYKVSRSKLYGLWRQGLGPKTLKFGRVVRISREAARAWVQQMEGAA